MDKVGARAVCAAAWVAKSDVGLVEAARVVQYSLEAEVRLDPEEARRDRCELLRDLFGNPFRPVSFDPAGLAANGTAVIALARSIHDDRRFEDLPVLADALEQAGYGEPEVLGHCRLGSEHVRGCWVLDLVLGWP
jgi:hypothetical protein